MEFFRDNALILAAIAALVVIGVLLVTNRLRKLGSLALKGVVGGAALWGINGVVAFLGLGVALPGINLLTITIAALLGLPGVVLIYGINFLL
ncbi:MAG: pro-sigmaK processing inhibitor BofA family protein [Clostridiales bacterium]|nr:pro-sigmaK processing inhibitor BofA family protein [Clostridiales bacterium]